jgi:FKBP-type peptidyl-prolyl cis-trans isomerase SlyD
MSSDRVTRHKAVYITYSIVLENDQVFEQSDLPVGYIHGVDGPLFPVIEAALEGKSAGDRVEVTVTPDEGFGPHDPNLAFTDDIDNVPPQYRYLGADVAFENDQGETMEFKVTNIADGKLTIDGNHPLAGKTITFVVDVVSLRDATPEEVRQGVPADMAAPLH